MTNHGEFIRGLRKAWRDEMRSAANYRALAAREPVPPRRAILERMASAEERHAQRWAKRLEELGAPPGEFSETFIEMLRRWILLRSETGVAAKMLEAGEGDADELYEKLLATAPSKKDRSDLEYAAREERAHAKVLGEFEDRQLHPQGKLERILRRERWHVRAGGWIGQAIYGANDGPVPRSAS